MTWTYSPTSLSTDLAKVRRLVGDTDTTDQLLSDEEIAFFLDEQSDNLRRAAADCCDAVAANLARKVDTSNGALSISASRRAEAYRAHAVVLREQAREMSVPVPFAGGTSIAENDAQDADSDAVQPQHRVGGDDFPGAARSVSTSDDDD